MLIIYAHPNKDGHCGYVLKKLMESLDNAKKKYEVMDLYEMKYNPVLQPNEHYTSGHYNVSSENKNIQEKIINNNELIFIYPTWWNSTPAILKGFFDRIFISHFAFQYDNTIPQGLLKNKKAAVITTTGGPVIYEKIIERDRSLKVVTKNVLNFCGIKAKGFMIGSCNKFTDRQKNKIEKTVKKVINYLGS